MFEIKSKIVIPENLKQIILEGRKAMLPPPDISVSEWSREFRYLPETSQHPGRYRPELTPYLIAIQDAFTDPNVEEVSTMKSAQVGYTTALENIMGYTIQINPQPIIYMAPTKDVSKMFSREKFDPMIEATPELRRRVSRRKSRDSDNTALYKRFQGGYILFVGANSPHGLRMLPIPVVISDDIDSIEIGSTKEGDPVLRAEKRSQTFEGRRKKVRGSTPTIDKASRIQNYFNQGTMEEWYVRCPQCEGEQSLTFDQIDWDKDQDAFGKVIRHYPETSFLYCKLCGTKLNEMDRYNMVMTGYWKAKHPERITHRSFHINEINSTLSSLRQIVTSYVSCFNGDILDDEKYETFTNLVLGLPYKRESVQELNEEELLQRVESYIGDDPFVIPKEILFLCSFTDVQKDRLETEVWGVGMHKELWIIGKQIIPGNPEVSPSISNSVWQLNDKYLNQEYTRSDGVSLKVIRKFVDSGYLSQTVYDYVRGRSTLGYWATKGRGTYGHPLLSNKFTWVDKGRTKLIHIGTNAAKASIFARLKIQQKGPKYIHFDEKYCNYEYFQQLTSEHGIKKQVGSIEIVIYEKKDKHLRNEALDILVGIVAAIEHVNPNWEGLKKRLDSLGVSSINIDVKSNNQTKQINKPEKIKRSSKANSIINW
jgi:phage terminase large subunit GpA-like protein